MYVYALFDNESSELVTIHFLNAASNKLLELYMQSFHSPKVRESAKNGIECAYEIIFSGEIEKYIQKAPISITPKDFKQQVDGSSAGLAYAVAFAVALKSRNIIDTSFDIPEKIAATGELDNHGNVTKVKHLKEKIIAAIKENVSLLLYPSENYAELSLLRESDIELDNSIKDSGISLKHVSNLKQAFCEIGIFPYTSLTINTVTNNEKYVSFDISLSNESKIEFSSFNLILMYDSSKLKLANILEGAVIKDSKYLEFISQEKIHKKFILTLNLKKETLHVLKNNSTLIKINFTAIDNLKKCTSDLLEFCEDECSINDFPCKNTGGFILKNSDISLLSEKGSSQLNPLNQREKANELSVTSFFKNKKKLLIAAGATALIIFSCYAYAANFKNSPHSPNVIGPIYEPTPTKNLNHTTTETPKPLSNYTPEKPTAVNSLLPTPQPTNLPQLSSTLLTPPIVATKTTPSITEGSNIIEAPTTTSKPSNKGILANTPVPVLMPIQIEEVMDTANWKSKCEYSSVDISNDEDRNSLAINYDIKGSGRVRVITETDVFRNLPVGYKKLKFSYRCSSEITSQDYVLIKIQCNNKTRQFPLGSTENISKENKWFQKVIEDLEINKITAIEVFIGTLGTDNADSAIDRGRILLNDVIVSP